MHQDMCESYGSVRRREGGLTARYLGDAGATRHFSLFQFFFFLFFIFETK